MEEQYTIVSFMKKARVDAQETTQQWVNWYMEQGYIPIGGVSVAVELDSRTGIVYYTFSQAVLLQNTTPPPLEPGKNA